MKMLQKSVCCLNIHRQVIVLRKVVVRVDWYDLLFMGLSGDIYLSYSTNLPGYFVKSKRKTKLLSNLPCFPYVLESFY